MGSITSLLIMLVGLIYVLLNKDKGIILQKDSPNPCYPELVNSTYNVDSTSAIRLYLVGEIHDQNIDRVRSCVASLIQPGDHLLIEFPDQGKAIPCDSLYKSYAMFTGVAKCYGFDTALKSKNRELFDSYRLRGDFIKMQYENLFMNAKTSQEVIKKFESLLDKYMAMPASAYVDPAKHDLNHSHDLNFYHAVYKELRKIIPKMQDLSLAQLRNFMVSENHRYYDISNHYFILARDGDTNDKLVPAIARHLKALSGSHNRLFAVAGQNHFDSKINKRLPQIFAEGHPTMVFSKP